MRAILLLMGLLVLSYIGSFLVGGRAVRGMGLPSGAEYVALGFVVGPQVLGLLERSMVSSFEPIAHVALGWLTLVIGLDFGYRDGKRVPAGRMILGIVGALITGACVAGAVWFVCERVALVQAFVPPGTPRVLLAGGVGAACAETTRHAVRWVVERFNARGPLADLIAELSHVDDVVPLVGAAVLFALVPAKIQLPWFVPIWAWVGGTVVIGFLLGGVAALLIGRTFSLNATWGVLFGVSLLAIGIATRLELASLAVTFFMGIGVAVVSRHAVELRDAVALTERPVLLPALLLAGARIEMHPSSALAWIVGAALLARLVGKSLSGGIFRLALPIARPAGGALGVGLLSSGAVSMCIGLAFALRFPGNVGDTVLVVAACAAVFGEFFAPLAMRRALVRAGEIDEAPSSARKGEEAAT